MNTIVKSTVSHWFPYQANCLQSEKFLLKEKLHPESVCEVVRSIMLLIKEDANKPIDIFLHAFRLDAPYTFFKC